MHTYARGPGTLLLLRFGFFSIRRVVFRIFPTSALFSLKNIFLRSFETNTIDICNSTLYALNCLRRSFRMTTPFLLFCAVGRPHPYFSKGRFYFYIIGISLLSNHSPCESFFIHKKARKHCVCGLFYGSPCWARTNDPAVNSRMLYRLS